MATLRNTDSAFSLGEGPPPESVMCVRFGMVTMETEVEELLSLVINCGKDIDEAVRLLLPSPCPPPPPCPSPPSCPPPPPCPLPPPYPPPSSPR